MRTRVEIGQWRIYFFCSGYLRLSLISCGIGKFDDASVWLTRALEVNDEQPDATICLGDLYYRKDHLVDARKCYDKICSSVRRFLSL